MKKNKILYYYKKYMYRKTKINDVILIKKTNFYKIQIKQKIHKNLQEQFMNNFYRQEVTKQKNMK